MPPTPPPLEFDPNPDPFLALNQEMFEQVVTFVDFAADRFTLGFVSVNFANDCDRFLVALERDPRCQAIQFDRFHLSDPTLRFLRDALAAELPRHPLAPGKKRVVVVTGLEGAIGMIGDYPMVLQDLNYVRDAFATTLPYPLLLCLPDSALTRLARFAPDFWAWRLGVFRFHTLPATVEAARQETAYSSIDTSLDLATKQTRIDLLLRLLAEHPPSQPQSTETNETRLDILNQLGQLYDSQGHITQAEQAFTEALDLAGVDDRFAVAKASALHCLGTLRKNQGDIDRAIDLYQQSLQVCEAIGNVQGKAATSHQMASIYAQQGQVEQAIDLYKQSLQITEVIGDMKTKAATLHQMAGIYAQQGQGSQALSLYQQSLQIKEAIGDVQGKAATLAMMGQLLAMKGDFTAAVSALRESMQILQHLRSPDSAKVQEMLTKIISSKVLQSPAGQAQLPQLQAGEAEAQQWLSAAVQQELAGD